MEKTKDGHLICIHDDTVDRTTNGSGKMSDMTLDEIRKLDAGSWFDAKFAGEKVPTIEEVLELVAEYRQHDVLIAVDLKAENVAQSVVRLAEKHGVLDRLLFIGGTISDPQVRAEIRAASDGCQNTPQHQGNEATGHAADVVKITLGKTLRLKKFTCKDVTHDYEQNTDNP